MGNAVLLFMLSRLVLSGQGASPGACAKFLAILAGLYGTFITLARHPERAVIGCKGYRGLMLVGCGPPSAPHRAQKRALLRGCGRTRQPSWPCRRSGRGTAR